MYDEKKFIARLQELMEDNKDNTVSLAKKLGVSSQAISHWLNGKREPLISSVCLIAKVYDVEIEYLVGMKDY